MLDAQAWISGNAQRMKIPFLILHGDSDKVTSVLGSKRFVANAASTDKSVQVIEDGYHIMLGYGIEEQITNQVFGQIISWLLIHS